MFLSTPEFTFLQTINYVGPSTNYEKWVKTYGAKQNSHGQRTNGLTTLMTNWIIQVSQLTSVGLPNWKSNTF